MVSGVFRIDTLARESPNSLVWTITFDSYPNNPKASQAGVEPALLITQGLPHAVGSLTLGHAPPRPTNYLPRPSAVQYRRWASSCVCIWHLGDTNGDACRPERWGLKVPIAEGAVDYIEDSRAPFVHQLVPSNLYKAHSSRSIQTSVTHCGGGEGGTMGFVADFPLWVYGIVCTYACIPTR